VGHGPVELEIDTIQDQEVAVIGSAMYHPVDFDRAEQLVMAVNGEQLVTTAMAIGDAVDAFNRAGSGTDTKIHLIGPAA
jgi:hypothetical protein